jgi:hypothetical protein
MYNVSDMSYSSGMLRFINFVPPCGFASFHKAEIGATLLMTSISKGCVGEGGIEFPISFPYNW